MSKKKKKQQQMDIFDKELKTVFIDPDRRYAVVETVDWEKYHTVLTLGDEYAKQLFIGQVFTITKEPPEAETDISEVSEESQDA